MEKISTLTTSDLEHCAKIYADAFSNPPWNEEWSEPAAKKRLQETFETPGFIGLGYFVDDQLLGLAVGYCEQWVNDKIFYFKELCINPHHQGKGIGKHLVTELKKVLQAQQVQKIYFMTMKDSDAYQAFLKIGFVPSERMIVMGCQLE